MLYLPSAAPGAVPAIRVPPTAAMLHSARCHRLWTELRVLLSIFPVVLVVEGASTTAQAALAASTANRVRV